MNTYANWTLWDATGKLLTPLMAVTNRTTDATDAVTRFEAAGINKQT